MRADLFRADDPEHVVASVAWRDRRVVVDHADDPEMVARIFHPAPVVVDEPAFRPTTATGPAVVEPGDIEWFRVAAVARGKQEGLEARLVTDAPGGWDPALIPRRTAGRGGSPRCPVSRSVHEVASGGFGAAADHYERRRPDYPEEAVDRLVQELEIGRACTVLDLGAGTGKLTRQLATLGPRIVAVEPVEAMRRSFAAGLPGVPVVAGVAEALPVLTGRFDAVVCAQAFHWFDGERALPEIHRALKPHGRFGLLWNVRDESVDWVLRLGEILEPYQSRVPQEASGDWRRAFSTTDWFGTLNRLRFPHHQPLDAEGLVERYASASYIAVLAEEERTDVLGRIRRLAQMHPDLAGRPSFDLPYITDLYWTSRRDADPPG